MNAKPAKPCGRLDRHDAHMWKRPPSPFRSLALEHRTFHCAGLVLIEGGCWVNWGAA